MKHKSVTLSFYILLQLTASDHATPRALVYRTKRALGVSHLQHKAKFDGVGLTIHLHGSNITVEAELIETL
jgi:hypothetical protein